MSPSRPHHGSLVRSTVLLTTLVAALAAALTGLIAWQTAANGAEQHELDQLMRQATVLSRLPAISEPVLDQSQPLTAPDDVQSAVLGSDGAVAGAAAPALDEASKAALLAGQTVETTGILDGREVLLVGHPAIGGGAIVLTEPYSVVSSETSQVRSNVIWPLAIGMLGAALAGALLARRTTRPLVAAAQVAHRLADGERGVRAPVHGPREAAEIGRALNVLDKALAHSENRQREFLQSVSHELRTPLTALQGYAEALADGLIEPDKVREVGGTLAAETSRLDRFLGDLLDLARLEADDFRLDLAPNDLTAIATAAAAFWCEPCARESVELRLETSTEPVPVVTDAFRVRQLIDGLIQNALRITPSGAPIVLAVLAGGNGVAGPGLQVRDGGPGLTAQDVRIAFDAGALNERYRGTRPVGSGLGLAIAHRLATRLGGTITIEGHGLEGGACFTVNLSPMS